MNLTAIALVRETFGQARLQSSEAVALFYGRLFTLDPTIRPLFKQNLDEHGQQFMQALLQAINGLGEPETIVTTIKQLGQRHTLYGVHPHHYHTFGQALLWTVAHQLGERYTPAVAEAWHEAYYLLAGLMKEAATPMEHHKP